MIKKTILLAILYFLSINKILAVDDDINDISPPSSQAHYYFLWKAYKDQTISNPSRVIDDLFETCPDLSRGIALKEDDFEVIMAQNIPDTASWSKAPLQSKTVYDDVIGFSYKPNITYLGKPLHYVSLGHDEHRLYFPPKQLCPVGDLLQRWGVNALHLHNTTPIDIISLIANLRLLCLNISQCTVSYEGTFQYDVDTLFTVPHLTFNIEDRTPHSIQCLAHEILSARDLSYLNMKGMRYLSQNQKDTFHVAIHQLNNFNKPLLKVANYQAPTFLERMAINARCIRRFFRK